MDSATQSQQTQAALSEPLWHAVVVPESQLPFVLTQPTWDQLIDTIRSTLQSRGGTCLYTFLGTRIQTTIPPVRFLTPFGEIPLSPAEDTPPVVDLRGRLYSVSAGEFDESLAEGEPG
jgi:hypothetical protein